MEVPAFDLFFAHGAARQLNSGHQDPIHVASTVKAPLCPDRNETLQKNLIAARLRFVR